MTEKVETHYRNQNWIWAKGTKLKFIKHMHCKCNLSNLWSQLTWEFLFSGSPINCNIYIHINGALRAEEYIARGHACDISYVPEGASPRRTYIRIARRARRARVLYDTSAREARLIWIISTSGCFLKLVVCTYCTTHEQLLVVGNFTVTSWFTANTVRYTN